jgi:ADP-ribosylglycohydrolase
MLDPGWRPADTTLPNGTVWTCLAQAVWAVRTCPDSFEDALRRAIDLGGDTDTVAAVAGGLAGARLGVDAIPGRWTIALHGHVTAVAGSKTYRTRDLEALTARLIAAP